MDISLKQALVFVPKNEHWIRNVLIGGLLLFFPAFGYIFPGIRKLFFAPVNYFMASLFVMLAGIVFLAVSGYFFKAVHNRVVHDKEGLPDWKYFSYYIYVGLKSYIGAFILSLPFILFFLLLMFFAPISFSRESIPFILLAGVAYIVYSFLFVIFALCFVRDFKISSFWNIKRAYDLISGNINNFVMFVLYCFLIAFAHLFLLGILANAQILALLIPFISFYVYLIYTDLFAQFIQSKEKVYSNEKECLV